MRTLISTLKPTSSPITFNHSMVCALAPHALGQQTQPRPQRCRLLLPCLCAYVGILAAGCGRHTMVNNPQMDYYSESTLWVATPPTTDIKPSDSTTTTDPIAAPAEEAEQDPPYGGSYVPMADSIDAQTMLAPADIDSLLYEQQMWQKQAGWLTGYSIQLYRGLSRKEAEKYRSLARKKTKLSVSMQYIQPTYQVWMGFFESALSAQQHLMALHKEVPSALVLTRKIRAADLLPPSPFSDADK